MVVVGLAVVVVVGLGLVGGLAVVVVVGLGLVSPPTRSLDNNVDTNLGLRQVVRGEIPSALSLLRISLIVNFFILAWVGLILRIFSSGRLCHLD